jgi:hypothetical protein
VRNAVAGACRAARAGDVERDTTLSASLLHAEPGNGQLWAPPQNDPPTASTDHGTTPRSDRSGRCQARWAAPVTGRRTSSSARRESAVWATRLPCISADTGWFQLLAAVSVLVEKHSLSRSARSAFSCRASAGTAATPRSSRPEPIRYRSARIRHRAHQGPRLLASRRPRQAELPDADRAALVTACYGRPRSPAGGSRAPREAHG